MPDASTSGNTPRKTTPVSSPSLPRSDSAPTLPGEKLPEDADEKTAEERVYEAETGRRVDKGEQEHKTEGEDDNVLWVDWDGPKDPLNPKKYLGHTEGNGLQRSLSSFTFISPVSSSMVAPATEQIAEQFGITSPILIAVTTSVFVLGCAFGPLILGPLSEIYGRSRVIQFSNLFYLGGSAPLSVGGGVLGDLWHPEERGRAIAIYSLAPLLGPVAGPLAMTKQITLTSNHIHSQPTSQPESPLRGFPLGTPPSCQTSRHRVKRETPSSDEKPTDIDCRDTVRKLNCQRDTALRETP
ncbi:hypothetical protein GALMADRAFT_137249 [Galerina marginata CBS 339.88]|uniref:Major facilitator superfamily (MFS) profile domain-containing protein n=1 Tax=Galerina marginata (strain CBS 339.88) TaxID=685588 RepID=A0A067T8F7_GALM3|nr:hypothetical protein GALMADRAFT_137249 [Galerina marginata CBS 339.88]